MTDKPQFRPGGILAADLASVVGIAYAAGDDTPVYGSARMGQRGCSVGECFYAYDAWLERRLDRLQPSIMIFETPILIGRGSANVVYRLMGLAALTETAALKRGIRIYQAENSTVMKHFVGRGGRWPSKKDKKQAVIRACELRGWRPTDDNAADALALLEFCQSMLNRERLVQRAAGELFTGGR